jgi:hypothetical protein
MCYTLLVGLGVVGLGGQNKYREAEGWVLLSFLFVR